MNEDGITPVMSMNPGYGNGFGLGNEGIWLFAILALMWGCGSLFGNGDADGRCATVEGLINSANFTHLEGQVMNNSRIEQQADATYSNPYNPGYEIAQQFGQINRQLSECRYTPQHAIDYVNCNDAINTVITMQAMQGDMRYPTALTYATGYSPFCDTASDCFLATAGRAFTPPTASIVTLMLRQNSITVTDDTTSNSATMTTTVIKSLSFTLYPMSGG